MAKTNKGRKFFATTATAALVASAIVPVASAAQINDFNSISSYAQEAVQDLNDRGIIKGDQKGNFNPKSAITRAEAATILTNALELEGSGSTSFTDVKKSAWYYEAIDAAVANGIFQGQGAGKFNPSANLTRSEAAIILVDAFGLEGSADLSTFKDSANVKSWAEEALSIAVANEVMKGDDKGNLNPNASITRQDFALMYFRTEAAETEEVSGSVKAINNTTVEVTFEDSIDDIKALDFAIEGLEVSNAVVKQTDKKTAVLTTSAQTADVEYTVTVNGEAIGKFKGISAVIPTKITTTTTSLQGVIGEQVTVKTQVTVADGQSKEGIPVTFNILNNERANDKVEVERTTNAEGVATYSYTRYYASEDTVTAYATKKSSLYDTAKVYWANKVQLSVTELTAGNDLANETKKTYKVAGAPSATYYVAIKENIGVTPDKVAQVKVQDHGTTNFTVPYELTTGGTQFAKVTTNSNGEGTFTIFASNESATPIVYKPESTPTTPQTYTYNKLDLQAQAPTVKFSKVDRLALTVKGEGTADSAEYAVAPTVYNASSVGGRTYTATVTDKDGKIAPEGTTAYVTFEEGNFAGDVYFTTAAENFQKVVKGAVFPVRVGKEGKATFRVAGKGATTYVKPTVFLNTAGVTSPVALDKADVQQVGEVTYFKSANVVNAKLNVTDQYGRTITSLNAGQEAFFTYQSVDQNGFAYRPTAITSGSSTVTIWAPVYGTDASGNQILLGYEQKTIQTPGTSVQQYNLAFDVTSTFGNATVKNAGGVDINPSQNLGNTKTYQVVSDAEGKAIVRVTSSAADTVSVNVTGASNFLPTQTATVSFVNSSVVPNVYSGDVATYNSQAGTLTFVGKKAVSIFGDKVKYTKGTEVIANYDAFISLLANATGTVSITRTVAEDGTATFNVYNISTSGIKPVDTAVSNPGAVALEAAKVAAAKLVAAEYTAESYKAVTDALAKEAAATTDAQKAALAKEINDAIAALVKAPETLGSVVFTSFEAKTANSVTEALGIFSEYAVAGTVSDAAITSVELIYTLENGTTTSRTVAVANGTFAETVPASAFTGTVKSVKAKVGSKETAAKVVTVKKGQ